MKKSAIILCMAIALLVPVTLDAREKSTLSISDKLINLLSQEGFVADQSGPLGPFSMQTFRKSAGAEYWMFAGVIRNKGTGLVGAELVFPPNVHAEEQLNLLQKICRALSCEDVSDYEICYLWGVIQTNLARNRISRFTCGDLQFRTNQESCIKEVIVEQTSSILKKQSAD